MDPYLYSSTNFDSWDFGEWQELEVEPCDLTKRLASLDAARGSQGRGRWDPTVTVWKKFPSEIPGKDQNSPSWGWRLKVVVGQIYRYLPRVFVARLPWWWILAGISSTGNKIVFSKFGNSETARCSNCCLHSLKRSQQVSSTWKWMAKDGRCNYSLLK